MEGEDRNKRKAMDRETSGRKRQEWKGKRGCGRGLKEGGLARSVEKEGLGRTFLYRLMEGSEWKRQEGTGMDGTRNVDEGRAAGREKRTKEEARNSAERRIYTAEKAKKWCKERTYKLRIRNRAIRIKQ